MGNHTAGLAMGRMAETLITMRTNQTALELLDEICAQWRGCDAEFEAVNPEHPHQIHPLIRNYTDPNGPLGALISEAFGDPGTDYTKGWSDSDNVAVADAWWDGPYGAFKKRYDFY